MRPLLIFDYDGTLHETMALYQDAVIETLDWLEKEQQIKLPYRPQERDIKRWIGMKPSAMWDDYLPQLAETLKSVSILRVRNHMIRHLDEKARWYSGVEDVLWRLKEEGYSMIVLSNCLERYAEAHWNAFRMERWFRAFYASESFDDKPKYDIVKQLLSGMGTEKAMVIGDRSPDRNAALKNGLPFIGCAYGYGTKEDLDGAAAVAEEPLQIADLVKNLS